MAREISGQGGEEFYGMPPQDEILMNEDEMLRGLLEASNFKTDKAYFKKIQIKRAGKMLFEFRVRPLEEDEVNACRKNATKYAPDPRGRNFPRIESETDYVKLRSHKIYTATVDEDKAKVWDNKALKDKLNVIQAFDVIDTVLMAGEKDYVCEVIDELSGYGSTREELAKN